jgi:hypothetical protein
VKGNSIYIELDNLLFAASLQSMRINMIHCEGQYKFKSLEESNPDSDFTINSTLLYADTLIFQNTTYTETLSFTLNDLSDYWTDSTITSLTIAKNIGLIHFIRNNGTEYYRY